MRRDQLAAKLDQRVELSPPARPEAPLCPKDNAQTEWLNSDTRDDTWCCPQCARFGFVLSDDYLARHPELSRAQVVGINQHRARQLTRDRKAALSAVPNEQARPA